MSEILDLKTIHDYNEFLGLETLNPLVSFVDFSKVEVLKHRCKCFGFYAVFLKEKIHGQITYGRSKYEGGGYQRRGRDCASARLRPALPS